MLKHHLVGFLTCGSLAWGLAACDSDDGATSDSSAMTATGGASATDADSEADADADTADADSGDSTSTSTSSDSTSTSGDTSECGADDECIEDTDCADGQQCLSCLCIGDPATTSAGSDSDTGGGGDPSFPNPDDGCPAGTTNGNTGVSPGVNVCIPACDPSAADIISACPQPATGNAPGACVLTTSNMGDACATDGTPMAGQQCEEGVFCLGTGNGMEAACLPAVGCLLVCPSGQTCPDGMSCSSGVCAYD